MKSSRERLAKLGVHVPEILLPKKERDLSKWSVIACDQFTSEKDYWQRCKENVGDQPSTLNIIFPECYLADVDKEKETKKINDTMKSYLEEELESQGEGLVYLNRSTPWVKKRQGLVLALDLDAYEFKAGTTSSIRPTEATVVDRLPARIAVRQEAVLDLPHILVLLDDPKDKLMTTAATQEKREIYNFELMEQGGHIQGWMIDQEQALAALADVLEELDSANPFLFAIGDGNHSLASAKEIWRKMKADGITDHPARYALVELENIHDSGLIFEPIHRILFQVDSQKLMGDLTEALSPQVEGVSDLETVKKQVETAGANTIGFYDGNEYQLLKLKPEENKLPAEIFHDFLDPWLENNSCEELDYIHGDEAFLELSKAQGNVGFYLPSIQKSEFFDLVDKKGSLPRKTFSIGEAQEKRYYLESRKLK